MNRTSDISNRSVIKINNQYWIVKNIEHVKPGKGPAYKKLSIKCLESGRSDIYTLGPSQLLEVVEARNKTVVFSHIQGEYACFLYGAEIIELELSFIKNELKFLIPELEITIKEINDQIISLELPIKIDYIVDRLESSQKTQEKQVAIVNNQIRISVPSFIKIGDKIRINTEKCEFEERVK